VRFILAVISDTLVIRNRKRDDLLSELREKKFAPFPRKKAAKVAVSCTYGSREVLHLYGE
jgi:hypothetical protein